MRVVPIKKIIPAVLVWGAGGWDLLALAARDALAAAPSLPSLT